MNAVHPSQLPPLHSPSSPRLLQHPVSERQQQPSVRAHIRGTANLSRALLSGTPCLETTEQVNEDGLVVWLWICRLAPFILVTGPQLNLVCWDIVEGRSGYEVRTRMARLNWCFAALLNWAKFLFFCLFPLKLSKTGKVSPHPPQVLLCEPLLFVFIVLD